jgi:hypothetical protein
MDYSGKLHMIGNFRTKPRAYFIRRSIAVHFQSPRIRDGERHFYDKLKKIKVYETDSITSQLCLIQDGKSIIVEPSTSEFHLQDHEDGLRIYVPQDEDLQYHCFFDGLPARLLQWIMTDPSTGFGEFNGDALQAMWAVIHAQNKHISTALNRCGIMSIDIPDDSIHATSRQGTANSRIPLSPELDQPDHEVDHEYLGILRSTVTLARKAVLPSRDTIDMTAPARNLHADEDSDDREEDSDDREEDSDNSEEGSDNPEYDLDLSPSDKIERDKKIGGELFMSILGHVHTVIFKANLSFQVFEILSRLTPALPGFSRENWQSTIRHYVRIHEDYADFTP